MSSGGIAQLVEQGTENPCVSGSIPLLATIFLLLNYSDIESMYVKIPLLSGSIPLLATIFIFQIFSDINISLL